MLKIYQKVYVQDLLESIEISLCHAIVFSIKADLLLILNQAEDQFQKDLIVYQHLVKKLMYLACSI